MLVQDMESSILSFIQSSVSEKSNDGLNAETPLLELGILDSLSMVGLLSFIEHTFGVRIPEDQLVPENFESIRAIARKSVELADPPEESVPVERPAARDAEVVGEQMPIFPLRKLLSGGRIVHGRTVAGAEPTWIMIPALGIGSASWDPTLSRLGGAYAGVALDLAGFGESDVGTETPGYLDQVALVASYLDSLSGPLVLVGCSAGAMIAAEIARREEYRVDALVLSGFGHFPDSDRWHSEMQRLQAPTIASTRLLRNGQDPVARAAFASFFDDSARASVSSIFDELRQPVLLVAGRQDKLVSAESVEAAAKRIKSSRVEWIGDCGHLVPLECPDQFVQAVKAFLDSTAAS